MAHDNIMSASTCSWDGSLENHNVFFAEGDSATLGIRSAQPINVRQNKSVPHVVLVFWGGGIKNLAGKSLLVALHREVWLCALHRNNQARVCCYPWAGGFAILLVLAPFLWDWIGCGCVMPVPVLLLVVFIVCLCKIYWGKGEAGIEIRGVCNLNIQVIAEVVELHQPQQFFLYWQHSTPKILQKLHLPLVHPFSFCGCFPGLLLWPRQPLFLTSQKPIPA